MKQSGEAMSWNKVSEQNNEAKKKPRAMKQGNDVSALTTTTSNKHEVIASLTNSPQK